MLRIPQKDGILNAFRLSKLTRIGAAGDQGATGIGAAARSWYDPVRDSGIRSCAPGLAGGVELRNGHVREP